MFGCGCENRTHHLLLMRQLCPPVHLTASLARKVGFEPTTARFVAEDSIQLRLLTYHLVAREGIEPSPIAYQASVQTTILSGKNLVPLHRIELRYSDYKTDVMTIIRKGLGGPTGNRTPLPR